MSSSQALKKVLTTPSKIASALDWRKISGSVLSLDIHQDRIGLAIASHPSYGERANPFDDIQLARKGRLTEGCRERLAQLVHQYRVCGVVVSWPLQHDSGRMGAACGRVLHTLEELLQDKTIANRPMCLWDGAHAQPEPEDQWGRCTAYTRTSSKTEHKASIEQYHEDENMVAATIWDDFCRVHWPEIYQTASQASSTPSSNLNYYSSSYASSSNTSLDDVHWEDTSSYVNAALL